MSQHIFYKRLCIFLLIACALLLAPASALAYFLYYMSSSVQILYAEKVIHDVARCRRIECAQEAAGLFATSSASRGDIPQFYFDDRYPGAYDEGNTFVLFKMRSLSGPDPFYFHAVYDEDGALIVIFPTGE